MRSFSLRLLFALEIFICACLAAGADTLPSRDISGLIGIQKQLRFSVSDYRDPQGKSWIRLSGECEGAYRQSIDDLVATLWDFANAPKTFARIDSCRLIADDGRTAEIEQNTGVRILGLAFLSRAVFRDTLIRDEDTAAISFESIDVDDTMLSSKGEWLLEDRSDSSGCATYVRYKLESIVEPRFPGQLYIMRQFGPADMQALLKQLNEATAKRGKKG
jgi:hypothetical protein